MWLKQWEFDVWFPLISSGAFLVSLWFSLLPPSSGQKRWVENLSTKYFKTRLFLSLFYCFSKWFRCSALYSGAQRLFYFEANFYCWGRHSWSLAHQVQSHFPPWRQNSWASQYLLPRGGVCQSSPADYCPRWILWILLGFDNDWAQLWLFNGLSRDVYFFLTFFPCPSSFFPVLPETLCSCPTSALGPGGNFQLWVLSFFNFLITSPSGQ